MTIFHIDLREKTLDEIGSESQIAELCLKICNAVYEYFIHEIFVDQNDKKIKLIKSRDNIHLGLIDIMLLDNQLSRQVIFQSITVGSTDKITSMPTLEYFPPTTSNPMLEHFPPKQGGHQERNIAPVIINGVVNLLLRQTFKCLMKRNARNAKNIEIINKNWTKIQLIVNDVIKIINTLPFSEYIIDNVDVDLIILKFEIIDGRDMLVEMLSTQVDFLEKLSNVL